jgi:hypothetical protein
MCRHLSDEILSISSGLFDGDIELLAQLFYYDA